MVADSALPSSSNNVTPPVHDYEYYRSIVRGQRFPLAYVDLDLLEQNMRQIASLAGDKRIRLASKSIRCLPLLKRILAFDPCYQGIMCYTAHEAVYLAEQGMKDLLIGYPCWNEQDLMAVAQATAHGAQITLMIDSLAHVEQIEAVARQCGVRLPLCLDIDTALHLPGLHFGVWRSPLRTVQQARPVVERIQRSVHVWLDGLMGYEAQIAGVGDNYPGQTVKNTMVRMLKQRSQREVAQHRAQFVELVTSYGISLRFVNGGGTGSLATTRTENVVTEITVGSGFFSPALFDNYRDFRYQPAAGFAIEIVRHAYPTIYTCLGGGYTASGAAGRDKLPQPYLPRGARLEVLEGAGEVQTPIYYRGSQQLSLGDPIFMRHAKAGELSERFNHLLLISRGSIVDTLSTYRGEGHCFL